MELHLALKNIVNLSGTSILKEQRLVNILADFNAYGDVPSAKFIIKTIIDEGYMEKLLANGKWDLNCDKLVGQFATMTGIVKDNVNYVFESLGYSLGWYTSSITIPNQGISNKPTSTNSTGLQCTLECGNGNNLSGFVLSNPSVRKLDNNKIIVACTITGTFKKGCSGIAVRSAIFKDNSIIKDQFIENIWKVSFTGFCLASNEIDLDINADEINKIIFYIA